MGNDSAEQYVNRPLSKMAVWAGVVLAGAALLAGIVGPASAAGARRANGS